MEVELIQTIGTPCAADMWGNHVIEWKRIHAGEEKKKKRH